MAEVRIGHASSDENKKLKNGVAGDQTKKEVCIRTWYKHSKKWVVLRCKDPDKREKIAICMEKICADDRVGYDQSQRNSLFNNIKDKGWDPDKISKNVETDCSALAMRVCVAYAFGEDIVGDVRTATGPDILVKTGHFEKLTGSKYSDSSKDLMRGDILCTSVKGHAVVVLDNGENVIKALTAPKEVEAVESPDKGPVSKYNHEYKTTGKLNIRNGAGTKSNKYGTNKRVLVTVKKGTKVRCRGKYTDLYGKVWLYVDFTYNGTKYTGFASKSYLKRVY